mgnify:CR=1 FL=1
MTKVFGEEYFTFMNIPSPLWATYVCIGFPKVLLYLYRNPSLLTCVAERILKRNIELIKTLNSIGVNGVFIEECLTSRDVISLEPFRKYSKPYVSRLINKCKCLGLKTVYYFCGDVSDRLEDLINVGPDAISLEESKKGFNIDIEWVHEVVKGRCCILGNIDSVWIKEQ